MKKIILVTLALISLVGLSACRESDKVSYNIGKEADNFNLRRRVTII